jgi:SAM-dependent methyltransferase
LEREVERMEPYGKTLVDYYDLFFTGLKGDVAFYVEEAQKAGSPVLELGCGTGRVLIPVAESGIEIVGLDASKDMLSVIRRKISALDEQVQSRIEIVEGDMTDFSIGKKFSLVMIPCRSFLQLMTPEEQRAALLCIREHLADDGRLIMNMFDPRLDVLLDDPNAPGRIEEMTDPKSGNRVTMRCTAVHDLQRQVLEADFAFEEFDSKGKRISHVHAPLTIRWIYRWEMHYLLELCGFTVEALYGDFERGPFRYGEEQIWVAGKGG